MPNKILLCKLFVFLGIVYSNATPIFDAYIKASNTNSGDNFGYTVAISGNTAVVGAPEEFSNSRIINGDQSDNSAVRAGAAYVFVREGGIWIQQAYLKPSNLDPEDYFGSSVAIFGNTIVVGASREDSDASGVNGDEFSDPSQSFNSGAAYVFVREGVTWAQQAYLKASNPGEGDSFGASVAIDGETILVGALAEDSSATGIDGDQNDNGNTNSGAAYVFARIGNTWTQEAYLKASNVGGFFGCSVAISGGTAVIGARTEPSNSTGVDGDQNDNSAGGAGAAYIFTHDGASWSQQAYLKASNTQADDQFGHSVAISGETVVVGAYKEDSDSTTFGSDQFSDPSANFDSGAAYVFVRDGASWSQQAYLKARNTGQWDEFGKAVAISDDTIIIGACSEDSGATGVDGDFLDNNAQESGAVYVYMRGGTTWTYHSYLKPPNTEAQDEFGNTVSIWGDIALVGAHFEDSAATGINGDQGGGAAGSGAVYSFNVPPLQPEIVVEFRPPGIEISDGGLANFGGKPLGQHSVVTFTIRNIGLGDLTGLSVTKDEVGLDLFTITSMPESSLATQQSTQFSVQFDHSSPGTKTASLQIANNDSNEDPFNIQISGRGLTEDNDFDLDGINDLSEYRMAVQGFLWDVSQPELVNNLFENASSVGLYTETELGSINVNSPLIEVSDGTVRVELQLQKSDDLIYWENLGSPVEWTDTADQKQFYRLFFNEE